MYQALYRKWRPRTFDDVVGQSHITDTLKRQIVTDRLSHAYLFTGTRGTGKTTCAKLLARAVNCEHPVDGNPCNACPSCLGIENGSILDVLELDAASNNGVDQVRALRDEAIYTPAAVKKRVYIVDEVHMLSTPAFNALLKILEEPPPHLMFILATTELHKVPATIKSRCQQFSFKRIPSRSIAERLRYVSQEEGIQLSDQAAVLLSRLADGGLRDGLSLLDQCIGGADTLTEQGILQVLGLAGNLETAQLLKMIARQDASSALEKLGALYQEGKDMGALLGELSTLTRDLLIRKTAPQGGDALLSGGYEESVLRDLSQLMTIATLTRCLTILQNASAELYRSSNRRTDAELCIIRLCAESLDTSPQGLAARLSRLEERLAGGVPVTPDPSTAEQTVAEALERTPLPVEAAAAPRVEAPIEEKALPPWEVSEPAKPQAALHPVSGSAQPSSNQSVSGRPATPRSEQWSSFVESLRGKVPPASYTFLKNPELVRGILEEHTLRIWTDSAMTKGLLHKPDVLAALSSVAESYTGRSLRVDLQVGFPEESPQANTLPNETSQPGVKDDKLRDLLNLGKQFGNITIKE